MFGLKSLSYRDRELIETILENLPTSRIKKLDVHWEYISNGDTSFEGRSEVYRPRVSVELYEGTYE